MSRNQIEKLPRDLTPEGVAVFPWLNEPNTKFDHDGIYSVVLALPSDADVFNRITSIYDKFKTNVESKMVLSPNTSWHLPIKIGVRDLLSGKISYRSIDSFVGEHEEVVVDTRYLKFKTSAKWPDGKEKSPKLFDYNGKPLSKDHTIYADSIIRVSFTPITFCAGNNYGVSLILEAVQVKEFAEDRDSAGAYGFTEQSLEDIPSEDNPNEDLPF